MIRSLPSPFENCLVLSGPTAVGKSALALELSESLNAEIISADSMLVYRGMNIGTGKPSPEELARVPHYLIDCLEPWQSANVAWWLEQTQKTIQQIQAKGKQPLIVGGTPLYLKAIIAGLFDSPPSDPILRRQLEDEAKTSGAAGLHQQLQLCDPISAQRLHPNDLQRVIRALEVFLLTKKPLSSWQNQIGWQEKRASGPPFQLKNGKLQFLVLSLERQELYQRINQRVEQMFALGWIEEVKSLLNLPQPMSNQASKALGYQEIIAFLEGKMSLLETKERIATLTRQFAKRQLTWFRHLPGVIFSDNQLTIQLWGEKIR